MTVSPAFDKDFASSDFKYSAANLQHLLFGFCCETSLHFVINCSVSLALSSGEMSEEMAEPIAFKVGCYGIATQCESSHTSHLEDEYS